jgi:hypothetical protein
MRNHSLQRRSFGTLARETQACCELIDNGLVNWLPEPVPADSQMILSAFERHYAALDGRIGRLDDCRWQSKARLLIDGQLWPALQGSAGGRVSLVHFLRRHPSPRPIEHIHSADGRAGPVHLRSLGRRPRFLGPGDLKTRKFALESLHQVLESRFQA